ncbi:MAG: septum formation initiator family protein [Ilumatobacteraceae bacterium]
MSSGGHKTSSIARPKVGTRTRTHGVKPATKSTATARAKPKPKTNARSNAKPASKPKSKRPVGKTKPVRAAEGRDESRFADFTRPIPVEKQLVRGRKRRVLGIGGAVVTAAFIAALFVLPVQAWLRQQDDLDRKEDQLSALQDANAELANEVQVLQTPEGIEQAAREEIGYVQEGEIRYTMLPAPEAPLSLPGGWPYSTIAQIVAVRSEEAAKP